MTDRTSGNMPRDDDFLQLMGAFDQPIAASPAFADRLRRQLHTTAGMPATASESNPGSSVKSLIAPLQVHNPAPLQSREPGPGPTNGSRAHSHPFGFTLFSVAATILLALAIAGGAFYGLMRSPESDQTERGSDIRAIIATPFIAAGQSSTGSGGNWGGNSGHTWASDLPQFTSGFVDISPSGKNAGLANMQSVVSNGRILAVQRPSLSETEGPKLEAFALNGKPAWTQDIAVMPGMAIDNDRVYVIQDDLTNASVNRRVTAISLPGGEIAWTGPNVGTSGKLAWDWAPVVSDGIVYIADTAGTTYALKASDGTIIWESRVPADTVPNRADGSSETQTGGVIAMDDKAIYVSGWVNTVRKLDPKTGKELATIALPDGTSSYDLQLGGNTLIASGIFDSQDSEMASSIVAIDTTTDKIRWSYEYPTRYDGNAVVLADRVIVPVRSAKDAPIQLDAIDLQTGAITQVPNLTLTAYYVSLSATEGKEPLLFVAGSDGSLTVVNAITGAVIAEESPSTATASGSFRQPPVFVSGDSLVFVQSDGTWFTITPRSK
jgi:outer membrane protein assembly factor BamB